MTKTQRQGLADCFEGCWDKESALELLGLEASPIASALWDRWQSQMDEQGYYIFLD